ncbi:hypothetical protein RRG08_064583 [Elysia crispata]|uniref:Uncharacterized protein n=1 Tax=Elysia crispata TaxID=231223 RepID=A0AAE1EBY6_9GAST|nr:hypothetical protein RRG08_064583 [Elysia crispata]
MVNDALQENGCSIFRLSRACAMESHRDGKSLRGSILSKHLTELDKVSSASGISAVTHARVRFDWALVKDEVGDWRGVGGIKAMS